MFGKLMSGRVKQTVTKAVILLPFAVRRPFGVDVLRIPRAQ